MYIDRILYPIHTLGPGNRAVIWTKGCSKGCKNCSNPELWHIGKAAKRRSVKELFQIILNISRENRIDGITFTGGDPIEQFDELIEFIKLLKEITNDILVYTGDYFKDLSKNKQEKIKKNISVLIDGPYIHELNFKYVNLRGSKNQNIIYFNKKLKYKYKKYMKKGRMIQNIIMGEKIISVGIHDRQEESNSG